VAVWVREAGLEGVSANQIATRLGRLEAPAADLLQDLAADGSVIAFEPGTDKPMRWVDSSLIANLQKTARSLLTQYLDRERLATGMPKAEAVRRLMPNTSPEAARIHLEHLEKARVLEVQDDLIALPGRSAQLTGEESGLSARLQEIYEHAGLAPPAPTEAADATGSKPQIVDGVVGYLIRQGVLRRLAGGLIISSVALEKLRVDLLASELDNFTVAQFKELFGITRKWAIPILEHLDSQRITHRTGNTRKIARPRKEGS
jgi:selenocysteine-specific elongation factor